MSHEECTFVNRDKTVLPNSVVSGPCLQGNRSVAVVCPKRI